MWKGKRKAKPAGQVKAVRDCLMRLHQQPKRIKSIITIIEFDDSTSACDWSSMTLAQLTFLERALSIRISDQLRGMAATKPKACG